MDSKPSFAEHYVPMERARLRTRLQGRRSCLCADARLSR
jgi:hypothetical protein